MTNQHGDFIWYELMTADADAAEKFYGAVVGWTFAPSGQPGMDYRMFSSADAQVGGLMAITSEMSAGGARPAWLGYVGVDDVDKMAASVTEGGGAVHMAPQDIPGVGRFAFVADPQGAMIYVMRGASDEPSLSFASDRPRDGHCAWNELSTTDPAAALHFYGTRFGWVKDGEMDMPVPSDVEGGEMGQYHFLRHGEGMIGAVMPKMPQMPVSAWTYYFRVPDIDAAVATIGEQGGQVVQPPIEIPGGEFSMVGLDPQGAVFALVGPRKG